MRRRALHDEIDPIRRDVDSRELFGQLVDLRDDDAAFERRRFGDDRRVLGVRSRVQIAVAIGCLGGDKRDVGRQIDEIAAEQFEIGVDRADRDLTVAGELREARCLRAGKRKIQPRRDAALEHVEVLRKREDRLHDMQVMDPRAVDLSQRAREEVGLLLIVAFETDAIAGQDHFLEQGNDGVGIDDLARQPSAETRRRAGQTPLATLRALVPDPRRDSRIHP